jgi:hypothetical protein
MQHDDETSTSSPSVEPSRKKQKRNRIDEMNDMLIININPLTAQKVVKFAASSGMVYEANVPVNQSLTPIPMETAIRRYPIEMKKLSIEEYNLQQITKQNHSILQAIDRLYDPDFTKRNRRYKQRHRTNKNNRRNSFYIPSTSSDYNKRNNTDEMLHTI